MKQSALECAAFCVLLGVGLCADSLGTTPGGWYIMAGGVAVAVALYCAGQHVGYQTERERTRGRRKRRSARSQTGVPGKTEPLSHGLAVTAPLTGAPITGKKKAATVTATPRRQVKQSAQAIISHPYFNGEKGDSQDGI